MIQYASKDAIRAYKDGEKPLSKWSKSDIMQGIEEMIASGEATTKAEMLPHISRLPLPVMKKWLLRKSSCHKTGNTERNTYFYIIDKASVESMSCEKIAKILSYEKSNPIQKQGRRCECSFLIWQGPKRNRIPTRIQETGEIKGDWFIRPDGSRKSIRGAGFRVVREIN